MAAPYVGPWKTQLLEGVVQKPVLRARGQWMVPVDHAGAKEPVQTTCKACGVLLLLAASAEPPDGQ